MVQVNSVAKDVNVQNYKNAKFSQQNLSFKGNNEISKTNNSVMSKGLANAVKSMALAGMLMAGVAGCGKSEQPSFDTKEDVKTELRKSIYGKDVEKVLIEKEFGELISSTNAVLDKKGMTVEQKKDFLTKNFDKVIDETSDILFNGSKEDIQKNVKLLKENSKQIAEIMTNEKLQTSEKAKEFIKLFNNNKNMTVPISIILGLVIAGLGAATRNIYVDSAGYIVASLLIFNALAGIKENNQRAEDILTGIIDRVEQKAEIGK